MAQRLSALRVPRVSFVDRAAVRDPANPTEPRRFVLFKSQGSEPVIPTKGAPVLTDAQKAELDPSVREMIEKSEQETAAAQAALEKAQKETADEKTAREAAEAKMKKGDEPPVEEIDKSELPPAVVAALEKAEQRERAADERIAKADAKAENAEKVAKAEADRRVTQEFITKADTGELRGLPSAPADIGPVMKSLAEAAPEAWATFEKSVLTPAAAQIREGLLFKEAGRPGEGAPVDSPLAKFNEKVAELQKSDSTLSRSAAMEAVRKANPALQEQIAEQMGTGAR